MANRGFVIVLGGQSKAEGVLNQRLGFGGFVFRFRPFHRELEIFGCLAVEPFAQLHRCQLVEGGRIGGSAAVIALQLGQGDFVTTNAQNLPGNHHSGGAQQNNETNQVGLGKECVQWGL